MHPNAQEGLRDWILRQLDPNIGCGPGQCDFLRERSRSNVSTDLNIFSKSLTTRSSTPTAIAVNNDEVARLATLSTLMLKPSSATRSSENLAPDVVEDEEVDDCGGGGNEMIKKLLSLKSG